MIKLEIFRPRGRRKYVERFDEPAKASQRAAALRRSGYCVIEAEVVERHEPTAAERKRRERHRAKVREVRKRISERKWAAIHAASEQLERELQASGKLGIRAALQRARKLAPKAHIQTSIGPARAAFLSSPVACRINGGRIVTIGNLVQFFSVEHEVEGPTFEAALETLAGKLKGAQHA